MLSSSGNPPAVGQAVTFTATVRGGGTPTGSVAFRDSATTLGTIPLGGGVASFTTVALAAGIHTVTAVYGGDATFAPSTAAISVAVGPITVEPLPLPRAGGSSVGGVPIAPPATRVPSSAPGGPVPQPQPMRR